MKKLIVVFFIIGIFSGGILLVRHKKAKLAAAPAPTARPTPVRTAMAKTGTLSDIRNYLGLVEPWQTAELSSQITGRIVKIVPREGDSVHQGQVLVVLDDAELRNTLAEAEATLATLKQNVTYWEREMERDTTLAKEGAIAQAVADATADRLNDARGRFRAQRKKCKALIARLAYSRIESPFNGVVSRRIADPGDLARPDRTLLVVEDRSRVKVCFDIPQKDVPYVQLGTPVKVQTKNGVKELKITRLYPTLNPNRTLTVEVNAPALNGLLSGSYYPVQVVLSCLEDVVLVPEECIITAPNGQTGVIVIENDKTAVRRVTVALVRNGKAAITGIGPGDTVVRSTYLGWTRLASGELIEVIR